MQNNLSIERSKQEQSAQTTKIKPKWHMTVLHVVYYLIMIAFLVFYMLPFWGTVMTSFKSNSEVMTTTPSHRRQSGQWRATRVRWRSLRSR